MISLPTRTSSRSSSKPMDPRVSLFGLRPWHTFCERNPRLPRTEEENPSPLPQACQPPQGDPRKVREARDIPLAGVVVRGRAVPGPVRHLQGQLLRELRLGHVLPHPGLRGPVFHRRGEEALLPQQVGRRPPRNVAAL